MCKSGRWAGAGIAFILISIASGEEPGPGERTEPRSGEACQVCCAPVGARDAAYRIEGQRVPVHAGPCDSALRAEPQRWLARLKPRGAFLDARVQQGRLSASWFIFGVYVLAGLLFASLCAHRALHSGQHAPLWFGLGLALNVPAYLLLLTRARREVRAPAGVPGGLAKIAATYAPTPCPACGATNHPAAGACTACGARLAPRMVSEVAKAGLGRSPAS